MSWNLPFVDIELYKGHEKVVLAKQFMQIIQQRMKMIPMGRVELSQKLGITPNYLSSLLSGKRIPTIELLAGFQFVLRVRFMVTLNGAVKHIAPADEKLNDLPQNDFQVEEAVESYSFYRCTTTKELAGA